MGLTVQSRTVAISIHKIWHMGFAWLVLTIKSVTSVTNKHTFDRERTMKSNDFVYKFCEIMEYENNH